MRTKGARGHCTGLTDAEVDAIVAVQYARFCDYRNEITNGMPDRRSRLFSGRVFDGRFFESV